LLAHAQNHQNTAVREISDSAQQLFLLTEIVELILLLRLLLFLLWNTISTTNHIWVFYAVVSKSDLNVVVFLFVQMRRAHHIVVSCIEIKGRYSAKNCQSFLSPATKSVWKPTFTSNCK